MARVNNFMNDTQKKSIYRAEMRQRFYEKGGRESIVVVNGTQLLLLFTTTTIEAFTKI